MSSTKAASLPSQEATSWPLICHESRSGPRLPCLLTNKSNQQIKPLLARHLLPACKIWAPLRELVSGDACIRRCPTPPGYFPSPRRQSSNRSHLGRSSPRQWKPSQDRLRLAPQLGTHPWTRHPCRSACMFPKVFVPRPLSAPEPFWLPSPYAGFAATIVSLAC